MIVTSTSASYKINSYIPDLEKREAKKILSDANQFELSIYLVHALKKSTNAYFSSHLLADGKSFKLTMKTDFIESACHVISCFREVLLKSYQQNTSHRLDITAFRKPLAAEIPPSADILTATALVIRPIIKKFLKTMGATDVLRISDNAFQFTWGNQQKRPIDEEASSKKRVIHKSDTIKKELPPGFKAGFKALLNKYEITEEDIFHKVKHAERLIYHFYSGGTLRQDNKIISFPIKVLSLEPYSIKLFILDFSLPADKRVMHFHISNFLSSPPLIPPFVPSSMIPPSIFHRSRADIEAEIATATAADYEFND